MRYRIAKLRELYGDVLEDPDARFELELALRTTGLRVRPDRALEDPQNAQLGSG